MKKTVQLNHFVNGELVTKCTLDVTADTRFNIGWPAFLIHEGVGYELMQEEASIAVYDITGFINLDVPCDSAPKS